MSFWVGIMRLSVLKILFLFLFTPVCLLGQIRTKTVTHSPVITPTISGSDTACANTSGYIYATEPGMTNYLWVVSSGGTISGGQGTASIMVTWSMVGIQTIQVIYDPATVPTVLNVQVLPSSLVGVTTSVSSNPVCAGFPVLFTAVPENGGVLPTYEWRINAVNAGN
ncbi:MAG: hypothetical protein WCK34_13980, partial [Bacteroidota bacterium]